MKVTLGTVIGALLGAIVIWFLWNNLLAAVVFFLAYFFASTVSKTLYANYKSKKAQTNG